MKNRPALGILFLVVFVDLLGFGIVIPQMPLYAELLGAPTAWIGLLMSGYSAMQFLFSPVWGRLSDRVGRRPVLLTSIAMTALAFLLYGLAGSFAWLLVSRLFAGVATANIAIAQAYIADVTLPEDRARGMGIIGMAFGLGFVLGPAIGGALSSVSLGAPGFAAAGLAAANFVWAYFVLPEPARRAEVVRRDRFAVLLRALSRPGIRRLLLIFFLTTAAFSAMEATFSLLARHRFALDVRQVSWLFAYLGVVMAVVQGGLIGPLARRFGEVRLLVAGAAIQALALAAFPLVAGWPGLLAGGAALAVGNGLVSPALSALLSRRARAEDQGGTLGIGQSASSMARIIGPEAGTLAFAGISPGAPYLGGAVLMAVAALVGFTVRSDSRDPV